MMPQTVPNRPMNGAVAPTLARKTIHRSSRSISRCTVTVIARSIRSRTLVCEMSAPATRTERRHSPIAAAKTEAMGWSGWRPRGRTVRRGCRRTRNGPRTRRRPYWLFESCSISRTPPPRPIRWRPAGQHDEFDDDVGLHEQAPQRQIAVRRSQIYRIHCPIHCLAPCCRCPYRSSCVLASRDARRLIQACADSRRVVKSPGRPTAPAPGHGEGQPTPLATLAGCGPVCFHRCERRRA